MIKKILIVDDTPVSRRILKSCITKVEQYEFVEAGDGLDGFEMFKTERPDLTFMDINMPKMSGIECLEAIRKFDSHAIVVMCSSEINPETLKTVTSLGALSVIHKPPTRESVQDAISKADNAKK
jgi:two-component system chemotaxis response regulator CheY